jgi:hypothetical protein
MSHDLFRILLALTLKDEENIDFQESDYLCERVISHDKYIHNTKLESAVGLFKHMKNEAYLYGLCDGSDLLKKKDKEDE